MAISEAFQNSATIGVTEWFLASNSGTKTDQTTDGIFQLVIDCNAVANGDEFRVRLYERISSAGTTRIAEEWVIANLPSSPLWFTPAVILMHGWEFSLQKILGTDRAIPWSIRQVA